MGKPQSFLDFSETICKRKTFFFLAREDEKDHVYTPALARLWSRTYHEKELLENKLVVEKLVRTSAA